MVSAMSGASIQSDWVGRVIDGKFSLLQWLGGGAHSAVFLTELPGPLAKKAAIKLSPDDGAESEDSVAGWAAARPLSHPNLMRLIHTGRCASEGVPVLYAVAEYADEVLAEILPERALTPAETGEMVRPVVDALTYLHGKGLVHGHLKPANILVVEDRLKISGDRLRTAGETGRPAAGLSVYDAPERANGTISAAGDVWSLGVLLVEALTQRPPVWDRSTGSDPLVPESIPQPFAGIARECLKADPASRCTLGSVKTRLGTGQPGAADTDDSEEKKKPSRFGVTALVVAAVVVAGVVAVVEMRPKGTPEAQPAVAVQPEAPPQSAEPEHAAAEQKPSPAVAATPVAQAPASEAHASKPIPMPGQAASGALADAVTPDVLAKALASIHGKFVVKVGVTVDSAGNVTDAAYVSQGPSSYFAKAALEAAKKSKFKPNPGGGSGKLTLQYLFTSEGAQITTSAAQ